MTLHVGTPEQDISRTGLFLLLAEKDSHTLLLVCRKLPPSNLTPVQKRSDGNHGCNRKYLLLDKMIEELEAFPVSVINFRHLMSRNTLCGLI